MPSPLDTADLRRRVQVCLDAELARQAGVLAELGPDVDDLLSAVADLLRGGKRLRAAFLYWGHRAAGRPDSDALVRLASAMELFQAAALIHDDVMDDSDTRRGRPAAHRALATRHAERGWAGDGDRFGLAGAVLAGNLCLTWTDEVYATSGIAAERPRPRPGGLRPDAHPAHGRAVPRRRRVDASVARPARRRTRRAGRAGSSATRAPSTASSTPCSSARRPAGSTPPGLDALSRYGLDLGRAFQLRDDLLGVFGDPEQHGQARG